MDKSKRYFYQPQPVYTLIFWSWNVVLLSLVFIVQLEQFKLNWYAPIVALCYAVFTILWLVRLHVNINNKQLIIYRFAHHQLTFPIDKIDVTKQGKWRLIINTHSLDFGNMTLLLFPKYRDRLYQQLTK